MKHRVLCFGGRDFDRVGLIAQALGSLGELLGDEFCIVHGGARGADRLSGEWAAKRGICVVEVRANWGVHGAQSAGPIRNQWMLDFCMPTYAVGFPGGRGTADMTRRVQDAGIPLWRPY